MKRMNREKLINAFEQIAQTEGYFFYTAESRFMPQMVKLHPAMWLAPPEFKSMQGCKHGAATYTVELSLMRLGIKADDKQKRAISVELEQSLIEIFATLSSFDFVAEVDKLQINHSSHTQTIHGEVAASATAEVITIF